MKDVFTYYIIFINLISFLTIYIDKKKAIKKKWRIKESTLIFLSIIGGSLGTYISMYTFKHKIRHLKFNLGIPIIILFQLSIYFLLKK
ncbi:MULTISPECIES: DUF1294 domain-containing protein [Clostridium]|jgi:uncharacterized membrane protein YsdA (DUF1294 family)|uniref:DUF1294 domain-containing protein n=1 Tax=bioreactor metagenome TaxID=1076179 RepID=A0A644X505_9ZZZZ|nr:DUF1294 domain-containing protein [Clostridium sp. C8]KLE16125.1 membrane protein [Clostridium sp. C8]